MWRPWHFRINTILFPSFRVVRGRNTGRRKRDGFRARASAPSANPDLKMKSEAKVVVIGGGVAGVSALYHLAKKGWGEDVVLLEKAELTSGSTWHAAGLLPLFNMSYSVGQIHKYSVKLYQELERRRARTWVSGKSATCAWP